MDAGNPTLVPLETVKKLIKPTLAFRALFKNKERGGKITFASISKLRCWGAVTRAVGYEREGSTKWLAKRNY